MPEHSALVRVLQIEIGTWPDLALATLELGRARWRLGRHSARTLIELARRQGRPKQMASPEASRLVDRVAFAIPRVAAHVPWRADCFIQALAAQSWLARSNVASEIWIGTRKDRLPGFEAHAWLLQDGRTITGGDVSGYTPLIGPDTPI